MFRFISKMEQAIVAAYQEGCEDGRKGALEEGIAKGRAEVYRAWYADWDMRRRTSIAKGIPFDKPPPLNPELIPPV